MDEIIDSIIRREAGYVVDQGGPTNYGITIPKLSEYLGRIATITDIKNLTPQTAKKLYQWMFKKYKIDGIKLPALVDLLFDCMVNSGEITAIRWLQNLAGVEADGKIGPKSLAAINKNPQELYYKLLAYRFRFYTDLAKQDKHKDSLRGWVNRGTEFIKVV